MEDIAPFIRWLWSWGWKIALCVLVAFVVFSIISELRWQKRYRYYIPHPVDWLSVMNTERWDTLEDLNQLMNSKLKVDLFKFYKSGDYIKLPWYVSRRRYPWIFRDDIEWLKQRGCIEHREMRYDKNGKECPDADFTVRNDQGETIGFDKEMMKGYSPPVDEYKKTASGGRVKRKPTHSRQEDEGFSGDPEGSRA